MKTDLYKKVTDQIIDLMETHGANWSKPWSAENLPALPMNAVTKKTYRGINILLLWSARHTVWASYKQWNSVSAQVRQGEKGTKIYFFMPIEKDKIGDTGKKTKERFLILREYTVFNADQVDGYEFNAPEIVTHDTIKECETFAANTGANINQDGGDRAFYRPATDSVHMPPLAAFRDAESYYATLFHELTHWTKQTQRCDREFSKRFGDQAYAMEELVAELGSAYTCAAIGISTTPRPDHAQYLNNWIKVLKEDNRAIFTASSKAMKAADYLESLQDQSQDIAA